MALTPDGNVYQDVDPATIDECWIDANSTYGLVKLAQDPAKQPFINDYIIEACAAINSICSRKFNQQTLDQIFRDEFLNVSTYQTYRLNNQPIVSITQVWLQVTNVFVPIDPQYFQVLFAEGLLKILPNTFFQAYNTIPPYTSHTSSNLWIRYVSGYTKENVPLVVKKATAMMVQYLFGVEDLATAVSSFRTQTYSQTNAKPEDDPQMAAIKKMLRPFINYYVE